MNFSFWNARERQVPLDFLQSPNFWKTTILRNSIINAIGNLKTTEANSRKAFSAGRQNAAQAKNTAAFHRAQVQRLAALANKHAHLCYEFDHPELIDHNLGWKEDPTCRRALKGCLGEIATLNLNPALVHLLAQHPPVVLIVNKWYSPGFTCSASDFHTWIWDQYEPVDTDT